MGLSCDRCQRPIARGDSHYLVRLRLTAGFDGYLPEPKEGESPDSLMDACASLDEATLIAQVDERFEFKVCPKCRNHIALDPLQRTTTLEAPKSLQ